MKKKKFLCFFLVLILCFSSTVPAYASSGGDILISESDSLSAENIGYSLGQFITKTILAPFNFATNYLESFQSGLDSILADNYANWLEKGYINPSADGLEMLPQTTQVINNYLRQFVQSYDGYYIVTPSSKLTLNDIILHYHYDSLKSGTLHSLFNLSSNICTQYWPVPSSCYSDYFSISSSTLFYLDKQKVSTYVMAYNVDYVPRIKLNDSGPSSYNDQSTYIYYYPNTYSIEYGLGQFATYSMGCPVKVFINLVSLNTYLTYGRTYIPYLPESNSMSIPRKYIDNPSLLPNVTYNVDKSNKTEEQIQNEYNNIINNYITNINNNSGGDSGGGSGGSSGGDSGGSGGGSGGGNITDTELYDFLTKLWNESDKKFDKMIDLLETNNKYQKKLVDSLNDIKAILVTQTVFDAFKNRSTDTANKAKEKFPTSIPWDVAMILNAMSAEPQELKFSLPIQVKSFGINESIEIDLSSEEWAKLAKTCRYLLSITFILILIQLTRKLFSSGGDD